MRQRDRYVVVRFNKANVKAILEDLSKKFSRIKLVEETYTASIVRCGHLQLPLVKERLSKLGVEILGVSGTIRKARRKFITESSVAAIVKKPADER